MKLASQFTANEIVLALLLLVRTQPSASTVDIMRGEQDMVYYGEDYNEMINYTDKETMVCNGSVKSCKCKGNDGYNTLIYNTDTKHIKCIKDEDEAIDIEGNDGMYLTNSSGGECLGVKDHKVYTTECNQNDLSLRWMWIGIFNIVNLKTLKCLQWNKDSSEFTAEQCNSVVKTQQWIRRNINKRKVMLNDKSIITEPLFFNPNFKTRTYKGCYRILEDKMIAVMKKPTVCKFQNKCNISIAINAPIFKQDRWTTCKVLWGKWNYSIFGQTWRLFPLADQNIFTLDHVNSETVTLNISNIGVFERWSGTLIKLRLKCGIEEHCVFLKIEGTWKNKTQPSTVSPPITTASFQTSSIVRSSFQTSSVVRSSFQTSSVVRSSFQTSSAVRSSFQASSAVRSSLHTSYVVRSSSQMSSVVRSSFQTSSSITRTSSPIKPSSKVSSMLFVVPIVVIFCLLVAASVVVVHYRRRRKRLNSKRDGPFYDESTARSTVVNYEDPAKLTEMQRRTPNPYESPGVNILVGNHYEYPTNCPPQQNSRRIPQNNEFQYDYATREETNLLPLLLNGDAILVDDTSGPAHNASRSQKPREKRDSQAGQSSEKPLYHTLEEADESHEEWDTHAGQSQEKPLYHTLEEEGKSHEKRDFHAGQSCEKPIYHTLEEDTSGVSLAHEERDTPARNTPEQPFYHTLESNNERMKTTSA